MCILVWQNGQLFMKSCSDILVPKPTGWRSERTGRFRTALSLWWLLGRRAGPLLCIAFRLVRGLFTKDPAQDSQSASSPSGFWIVIQIIWISLEWLLSSLDLLFNGKVPKIHFFQLPFWATWPSWIYTDCAANHGCSESVMQTPPWMPRWGNTPRRRTPSYSIVFVPIWHSQVWPVQA